MYDYLPDIITHFSNASQTIGPMMRPVIEQVSENAKDVIAALGPDSPLSLSEKLYHTGKATAFFGLLSLSAITANMEAAIPSGFVVGEELYTLDRLGARIRTLHGDDVQPRLF